MSTNSTKTMTPHFIKNILSLLDYADTIYDQTYNFSLLEKLKSVQYNARLAIAGAIRVTSTEKLYQELGWLLIS